jgi:hypothetical protein
MRIPLREEWRAGIARLYPDASAGFQNTNNCAHYFVQWFPGIDQYGILGLFERFKLAVHELFWKKVCRAVRQSLLDRLRIDIQVDERGRQGLISQYSTVSLLQRRTSKDHRAALVDLVLQFVMQALKPWRTIRVVERDSVLHLFDIRRRMKIVRVKKEPMQYVSDFCPDSRFPGTGYTHENNSFGIIVGHPCWPQSGLPFDNAGNAGLPTQSDILFDFVQGSAAHEHQQHPGAPFEFDMPSFHVPEAILDFRGVKSVLVDYENMEQLTTRKSKASQRELLIVPVKRLATGRR